MKILVITTSSFNYGVGIANVILNYYFNMDKTGIHIDFLCSKYIDDKLKSDIQTYGSRVYKICDRTKSPLKYIYTLSRIIKKEKYDIVHAHGNSSTLVLEMLAARLGKAKIRISHAHSTSSKVKLLHKLLRSINSKLCTHRFACSYEAGLWLFGNKRFEVVNNGINVDEYIFNERIRKEYREQLNLAEEDILLGQVSHFVETKNQTFTLRVFEKLYNKNNNYRLILIGDGRLKNDIQKEVEKLGLKDVVIFTGKTLNVKSYLQAIDVFLLPSKFEGLPLALLEAQAAGIPCFVSDRITHEVAITDLIKFLSINNNINEWVSLIEKCPIPNRDNSKEYIYNCFENSGYNIKSNSKRLKELYKSYLDESHNK